MEVFNKLKSAVSNVLPGNPLSRDYDLIGQVASCGPGLLWKIYAAVKRSTKEEASVFVFEKKSADHISRSDRETLIDLLRGGVQQLTKLRHPQILAVIHPIEESRESLAFATEPVFASLSNVLGKLSNISSVPRDLQEFQLHDMEIRHGILQLAEGLRFLHNDAKLLHGNINPEAVVLTRQGTWKLAGFEFCLHSTDPQMSDPMFLWREWRGDVIHLLQPHLDFLAPEYVLTQHCGTPSDMFSLGLLIYAVFAKGMTFLQCNGQLSSYNKNAEKLRHITANQLGEVPEGLREHVKLLLNMEPTVRPDAAQLSKVPYFEELGCVTLQYLDTLFQRENIEKSNFFKGLPKVVAKLPKRVNLQRILPPLVKESFNADMVPFLLPSMLLMAQQASQLEYQQYILPALIPLFKLQSPVQVVLIFMQNMSLLLSKTPKSDIQTHVLPMIFRALEADSPQIQIIKMPDNRKREAHGQIFMICCEKEHVWDPMFTGELCLSIIPTFAELIEYSTLKNSLIPRIKKLCLATSTLTVRVNCLLCIGQLLDYMDRWYVMDEILPFLSSIPSREPAVLMSILGIHKVALEDSKLGITKDALASKILPFLIPVCVDNNLNLTQFNAFMAVIRDMLGKVEGEHRSKLEQLDQMKQEQRSLEITRISGPDCDGSGDTAPHHNKPPSMMDKFLSGVGLSTLMGSQKSGLVDVKSNGTSFSSQTSGISMSVHQQGATSPVVTTPIATKKTTLSLEEKLKLAQQQEQQQRLKSQSSLNPTPASTTSIKSKVVGGPRDLTSTLMESNLSAMQSVGRAQSGSCGPSSMSSNGRSMLSSREPVGSGLPKGVSNWQQSNNSRQALAGKVDSQRSKVDLSAFDSLMTSPNTPPQSLNQMMSTSGQGFGATGLQLYSHSNSQNPIIMGQSTWGGPCVGMTQGPMVPIVPGQTTFGQMSNPWPAASLTSPMGQTSATGNVSSAASNYSTLGDLLG